MFDMLQKQEEEKRERRLAEMEKRLDAMEKGIASLRRKFQSVFRCNEENISEGSDEKLFPTFADEETMKSQNIVMLGGSNNYRQSTTKLELLDFKRNKSGEIDLRMPIFLYSCGSAFLNGELYIFGGYSRSKQEARKHLYKLGRDFKWKKLSPIRWSFDTSDIAYTSVVLDDCIWVVENEGKDMTKYIPISNSWVDLPPMLESRKKPGVAVVNNKIYVCGGENSKTVECFDPQTNSWEYFTPLPEERRSPGTIGLGSYLYVLGGWIKRLVFSESHRKEELIDSIQNTFWRINVEIEGSQWEELPEMAKGNGHFPVLLVDNQITAVDSGSTAYFNGEEWIKGPDLERSGHSAVVIPEELANYLYSYESNEND